ncbi:Isochorismatase hydrolase [Dissoconium aciculare CBS 342.82]|uniref:Isochorismatase hydrolase n=1 Tax=Dissoconium aciculare CBS 342.82 TaxID=1314786 RepID=A0A6J3M1U5_9PEZI|nr:Isochorismatase hydrolase [Dissoconium aciculare CBS 342.82]KAF1820897.1 Isochorismatase hydrolase [Dissoconium aciculare CBS 342.82]
MDQQMTVGPPDEFWKWSRSTGWDLTRRSSGLSTAEAANQRNLRLRCEVSCVTIDPVRSALVIIDMQNYSMSSALLGEVPAPYCRAQSKLLELAIPAARKAGIQIVWLNWGLTDDDLRTIGPGILRVFGWQRDNSSTGDEHWSSDLSQDTEIRSHTGLGEDLGTVTVDGKQVAAGRALMRDSWNAAIHGPLLQAYEDGQRLSPPDVLIHKTRNSGLWDDASECAKFLRTQNKRTLLLAGMNTDQCVLGTLIDAHARNYDTILLRDACATDSPDFAQKAVEYNCGRNLGFLSSCAEFAKSVQDLGLS